MIDANDYVSTVFSSGNVGNVIGCVDTRSARKRHLSDDLILFTQKKSRIDNSENSSRRAIAQARRSLYGATPISKDTKFNLENEGAGNSQSQCLPSQAELHVNSNMEFKHISQLIEKLAGDVSALSDSINDRIGKLESTLETRIVQKFANMLDKRMNYETAKIRKDIDTKLQAVRDEVRADLNEMDEKVGQLSANCVEKEESKRYLNIAIYGLLFHEGENLKSKVNSLIKEGLHVGNIQAVNAVRKTSDNDDNPGIVIATFQSAEERRTILSAKRKLKDSQQYKQVFVKKDQSFEERSLQRNLKVLVGALNEQGCPVEFRNNRVQKINQRYDNRGQGNRRNSDVHSDRHSGGYRASPGNRRNNNDSYSDNPRQNDKQKSFSDKSRQSDRQKSFSGDHVISDKSRQSDRQKSFSGDHVNSGYTQQRRGNNNNRGRENFSHGRQNYSNGSRHRNNH